MSVVFSDALSVPFQIENLGADSEDGDRERERERKKKKKKFHVTLMMRFITKIEAKWYEIMLCCLKHKVHP